MSEPYLVLDELGTFWLKVPEGFGEHSGKWMQQGGTSGENFLTLSDLAKSKGPLQEVRLSDLIVNRDGSWARA